MPTPTFVELDVGLPNFIRSLTSAFAISRALPLDKPFARARFFFFGAAPPSSSSSSSESESSASFAPHEGSLVFFSSMVDFASPILKICAETVLEVLGVAPRNPQEVATGVTPAPRACLLYMCSSTLPQVSNR